MIDRRATDPGRRAQPRHRLRRQDRRSSRRPAASRLLDLHGGRPRADRAAAAQSEKISLGRTVGEFLLRPSAPGRTHHRRGAPPARRGARRDGRAVVRLFRPLPGRARQRHARERIRLRLFRAARVRSRSPTRPRLPTSRTCRSTTSAGASSASRMRSRSGSSTIFENHGAEIARLAKTTAHPRVTRNSQARDSAEHFPST